MTGRGAPTGDEQAWLFATTWVHVFEEDSPRGAVYRPEDADIPLSRRPRTRFVLAPGGTARVFVAGPADRPAERRASWARVGGHVVVRVHDSPRRLTIVDRSPEQLIVQEGTGGGEGER